jgi:hypothetical protein
LMPRLWNSGDAAKGKPAAKMERKKVFAAGSSIIVVSHDGPPVDGNCDIPTADAALDV